jgi:hypothetical protein
MNAAAQGLTRLAQPGTRASELPWYRRPGMVAAWVVLSAAAGGRWLGQDRDYDSYLVFYEGLQGGLDFTQIRFEPGFVVFAWVCRNVAELPFEAFLAVTAAISLGLKFHLFNLRPLRWLLILIYVPTLYLLHEMTQIRVGLAVGFAYLAMDYQFSGRRSKAWIYMLVAVSIHATMLIFVPVLALSREWLSKQSLFAPMPIAMIISPALAVGALLGYFEAINPMVSFYIEALGHADVNLLSARSVALALIALIGVAGFEHFGARARLLVVIGLAGIGLFLSLAAVPTFAHRCLELTLLAYLLWVTSVPGKYAVSASAVLTVLAAFIGYRQLFIDPLFL